MRALGYQENDVPPRGPVTFVSHSGSAFSALLRNHRGIGFNLVVSAGQEFVTTMADYLDYALDQPTTRVAALLLETVRDAVGVPRRPGPRGTSPTSRWWRSRWAAPSRAGGW